MAKKKRIKYLLRAHTVYGKHQVQTTNVSTFRQLKSWKRAEIGVSPHEFRCS